MTDAPPKKRPWFQLHLSTCVVLMFVAGALLLVNIFLYTDSDISITINRYRFWGWPFTCYYTMTDLDGKALDWEPSYPWWDHTNPNLPWVPENVVKNVLVALALLAATALACEFLIRLRAHAAQEPAP